MGLRCLLRPALLSATLALVSCGAGTVAVSPTSAPTAATAALPTTATKPVRTFTPGNPEALRDDIQIRKLMETGGSYVRLVQDPLTKALFYMNSKADIYRFQLAENRSAKSTKVAGFVDIGVPAKFNATGLAFGPDGTMYVLGNIDEVNKTKAVIRKGVAGSDGKRTWTTLAETELYEKSNTQFDHVTNGIIVSPDNTYIYINSGSRTDHGEVQDSEGAFPDTREVPLTSAILRIPLDKDGQVIPSDETKLKEQGYFFADGIRNSYDFAFTNDGDLIGLDNGPDADFPDELNWIREGHHYGFPWKFGVDDNPQQFPGYDSTKDKRLSKDFFAVSQGFYRDDPEFPKPPMAFTDPIMNVGPDGDMYRAEDGSAVDMSDSGKPSATLTPHRSPLGLSFDSENAVGGGMTGNLFVVSWGAAGGDLPDPGLDLLSIKLTKKGDNYEAQTTQIVAGFDHPIDSVLVGKKLYVLDFSGKGTIWEVTLP